MAQDSNSGLLSSSVHHHSRLHRVQLFGHLVWHKDRTGKRMSPKLAWRVAGIASGHVEAIPDGVLAWWWRMQDLIPDPAAKQQDRAHAKKQV